VLVREIEIEGGCTYVDGENERNRERERERDRQTGRDLVYERECLYLYKI
jgi:hypothetical protein